LPAGTDSERLDAEPRWCRWPSASTSNDSANYVLGIVLFAVALILKGMSPSWAGAGTRKAPLAVGWIVFDLGTAAFATFPIIVSCSRPLRWLRLLTPSVLDLRDR
jgi:hypothetical protein